MRPFLAAACVVSAAVVLAYVLFPGSRRHLTGEDYLVENLSAVLYLGAVVLAVLYQLILWRKGRRCRALAWILWAGLLGFLEESSYCARLLHLRVPCVAGHKIDAAHDLVDFFCRMSAWMLGLRGATVGRLWALAAVLAILIAVRNRHGLRRAWTAVRQTPLRRLAALAVVLIAAAALLDLATVDRPLMSMFEELFEMLAALAVLFCALQAYESARAAR